MPRDNTYGTILSSAARTATATGGDVTNTQWAAVHVYINVSAGSGFSIVPVIQGKDPLSGTYYTLLTGNAITSQGLTVLKVGRGMLASPNACANDMLPYTWRIVLTPADTTSATYSVSYAMGA